MKEYNPTPTSKKVRYTTSIIYLLVITFLVLGSYINQQPDTSNNANVLNEDEIIWTEVN